MHRAKICSDAPSITNKFTYPSHRYLTNFKKNNFTLPKYLSQTSKHKISDRGPSLWKKVLSSTEKELQETSLFKAKLKLKLLERIIK